MIKDIYEQHKGKPVYSNTQLTGEIVGYSNHGILIASNKFGGWLGITEDCHIFKTCPTGYQFINYKYFENRHTEILKKLEKVSVHNLYILINSTDINFRSADWFQTECFNKPDSDDWFVPINRL